MISQAVLAGALWIFGVCAPSAPPALLAGIAMQESGFDPDAINDDTMHKSYYPGSPNAAVDLSVALQAHGDQIDVGLLGIDYTDWQRHGVPLVAAFDECTNAHVSAEILMGDYASATATGYRGETAWVAALSLYNAGRITPRGLAYARSVLANTQMLWPRIQLAMRRPTASAASALIAQQAPAPTSTPAPSLTEAVRIARERQTQASRAYAAIERAVQARTKAQRGAP
ncbi:hypothetical protein EPN42_04715 [bacterium]|nr:MAG: hypothetical protein EPN42_04715 [bacterium]